MILRAEDFATEWVQQYTTSWYASQVLVKDEITTLG
tara:strand:- start:343 stop:450 length:108 start_codon:yes stop_codon:yes gene_type:complete